MYYMLLLLKVCSACVSNYFLYQPTTGSNVCYKCPTNCSQCNSNGQSCTSCNSGYVLNVIIYKYYRMEDVYLYNKQIVPHLDKMDA